MLGLQNQLLSHRCDKYYFVLPEILCNLVNEIPFIKVSLSEVMIQMVLSISKYVIKKIKNIFDNIYHRYALYFKNVTRERCCNFLEDSVCLWSLFVVSFSTNTLNRLFVVT